jgi:diguanylate cyclase (GGDEF)-like protein
MIEHLPNLWRTGLSALLAAETEQAALEAAVTTVAELLDGPAVGVLKSRAEHLSSVAAHGQERFIAPLFVEALRRVDARLTPGQRRHRELFNLRRAITIPLREGDKIVGAISALASDEFSGAESPYIAILELAFVRTVERIRRLAETRLLYEISLRLGSTLDLPQLIHEVLALTTTTFATTSGRVFLYDERAGDLVMTLGPDTAPGASATLRVPLESTVAGWVVRNGDPLIRNERATDALALSDLETGATLGKLICVPLKHSDRTLGALMLINQPDGPDFLDDDLRLLTTIASSIAMMIANARLYERAIRDALTGAYNRGAFDNRLQEHWTRWQETGEGFALILLDLDNFKQINDRFGHTTGDAVLQSVTRLLWEALREDDTIYRYGGEEFAVLLGGLTDPTAVASIADRLRVMLDRELTINNLVSVRISASVGAALQPAHGATTPRALLDIADDAAYQAKRSGKNQVVLAPMPGE